jgi:formiminoglutamase
MNPFRPAAVDFKLTYDPRDPRLGFQRANLDDCDYALVGYPDDQGIRANNGRPGAALAPDVIRKYLLKMTPSLNLKPKVFFDAGNFVSKKTLSEAQAELIEALGHWHASGKKIISLGGGHDFGYPDCSAFLKNPKNKKPLVINFDAHLDVRPTTNGITSGTPFYQLLEERKDFDFVEVGIQPQCNSSEHLKWAKKKGAHVLEHSAWQNSGLTLKALFLKKFAKLLRKNRPCFISVDIDFFSSAVAPGCSQSWAYGAMPNDFFPLYDFLLTRLNVKGLGIYEVSPPLDQDDQTAKLAALIAHRFIYSPEKK